MTAMIRSYDTLVFDCDGVILNSNKVKTDAFYHAALPYGKKAADALVAHHVSLGGVSRYKKFAWFAKQFGNEDKQTQATKALLQSYAEYVQQGLLSCEVTPDLHQLREQTNAKWLIVSGGDQNELRALFKQRDMDQWFDGGIFGSPDDKITILQRELANNNINQPALFLGDSRYDYEAASHVDLDFVFLHDWTEFDQWPDFFMDKSVVTANKVADLL